MREIKFKCVLSEYKETDTEDIEIKVIGDVLNIDFHTNSIQVMFPDGNCEWYELDSIELVQYTGLKDCNGVEIYEGDIVVKKNYDTTYRLVRYDEKSCCFEFVTKKEKNKITNRGVIDSININSCCWHEVIGNIYENPELLEDDLS